MLSSLTETAIALLYDISNGGIPCYLQDFAGHTQVLPTLLNKLHKSGLIRLKEGSDENLISSYSLSRPSYKITLLDILEALDEHLNCNHPAYEEMYHRYRRAANKLGIINHMTRIYLSDIRLTDL